MTKNELIKHFSTVNFSNQKQKGVYYSAYEYEYKNPRPYVDGPHKETEKLIVQLLGKCRNDKLVTIRVGIDFEMDRLFSEPSYPRGVCHLPDILSQSLEPFISLCENDDFKQLAENLDLWITARKYNVSEPPYLGPEDFFERLSAIDFTNQNIHIELLSVTPLDNKRSELLKIEFSGQSDHSKTIDLAVIIPFSINDLLKEMKIDNTPDKIEYILKQISQNLELFCLIMDESDIKVLAEILS